MNTKPPGVRYPEQPRTQLTCRFSGPRRVTTKRIVPFSSGTGPTLETGTGRARQTLPLAGKWEQSRQADPQSRGTKRNTRPASLPGPKPPSRPPRVQLPDLCLENNVPHANWSLTAQLSSQLAPRALSQLILGGTPQGALCFLVFFFGHPAACGAPKAGIRSGPQSQPKQ